MAIFVIAFDVFGFRAEALYIRDSHGSPIFSLYENTKMKFSDYFYASIPSVCLAVPLAQYLPLISTNVEHSAKEILESYGVRFGIEETFKDLKDIWGWGKQELRLFESNEAATDRKSVV